MFAVTAVAAVVADKSLVELQWENCSAGKRRRTHALFASRRAHALHAKGERLLRSARLCQNGSPPEFIDDARNKPLRYDTFSIVTARKDKGGTSNDELNTHSLSFIVQRSAFTGV
jgi:hypothetical protein